MTPNSEASTGAVMGVLMSVMGSIIGLNTIQTLMASVAAGFLGGLGQYLFKKCLAYYHKRNLNEKD
ncbi:MAG: hypothetical protein DDT31_01746 [Syntrophomonadaceae bacterium]|nr:hypothetical protein [Bacillota bacterium]